MMMFLCLIEDIYHAEIQKCLLVDARENKTATSEQKSPPFKRLVLKNDFALNRYLVSVTIKIYRSTGNFSVETKHVELLRSYRFRLVKRNKMPSPKKSLNLVGNAFLNDSDLSGG